MNLLIERLPHFSRARNYYEEIAKFVLSITSEYGEAAKIATPFVILAFICVWIYATRKWGSKKRSVLTRSKFLGKLYGGDLALQRLLDYNEAHANPATLEYAEHLLKALLEEEHIDLRKLQSTVAKLEMSGKEAIAVDMLRKALHSRDKKPHEAYEIEMLMVEMLIYKGDFQEAMQCKCLNQEVIDADARRPLYKAVLHLMLKEIDEAQECWDEFIDIHRQFIEFKPSHAREETDETLTDFQEFKKKVKDLKIAIKEVAKPKPKPKQAAQK